MKTIFSYLKSHIKEDFNLWMYCYFAIFLAVTITLNYQFDFEHRVLNKYFTKPECYLFYTLFYAFAYFSIAIPKLLFSKKLEILKSKQFWLKTGFIMMILGFNAAFHFHRGLGQGLERAAKYFYTVISNNSVGIFTILMPVLLLKFIFDKSEKGFYGLSLKKHNYKPYFMMLLIMLPLIIWASFQPDFLRAYPTFKPWRIVKSDLFGWSYTQMGLLYEIVYLFDFTWTELAFRGALVIGMAKLLGKDAILPMVATYAFLHFGKPLGETIGSVFGGYILGVIALRSNHIIGGCIIHMGVAFLMDVTAYIQHSVG